MSDVLVHSRHRAIRAELWKWIPLWLQAAEEIGTTKFFFYSHGDERVPGMPAGKRVKVTFELEDDPNADLLQEATHADN